LTFGIEAFIEIEGEGSAGFVQNIIVTEIGAELLTTTPMLMWDE